MGKKLVFDKNKERYNTKQHIMGLNEIERPKEWIRGKRDGGNIVQQTA